MVIGPVHEANGDGGVLIDLNERTRILPIEPVHDVASAANGAPNQAGHELEDVAVTKESISRGLASGTEASGAGWGRYGFAFGRRSRGPGSSR
jgi:hypothetical protein